VLVVVVELVLSVREDVDVCDVVGRGVVVEGLVLVLEVVDDGAWVVV
jgi:hypothetical protein